MNKNLKENIAIFSLNPDLVDGFGHYLHYDLKIKNHLSSQTSDFYIFGHKTFQKSDHQHFIIPTFTKKTYDDIPLLTYSDLEKYKEDLRTAFAIIEKTVADKKVVYQYMGSVWHAWALAEIIQEFPLQNTTFKINIFHDRARLLAKDFDQSNYFAEYNFILKELEKSPLQLYTDTFEAQTAFEHFFNIKMSYLPMFSVSDFGEIEEKNVKGKIQFCYPGNVQKAKGFDVLVHALKRIDLNIGQFKIRTYISYLQKELQGWINEIPKHVNVEIIDGSLSTKEYSELLQNADVILLPYRAADFGGRTSGIYADAILLEKPVIITRETWGGAFTEKFDNGITFSDGNVEEMQKAIECMIEEFPEKKQAAIEARVQWADKNGIASFSHELLSSTINNTPLVAKLATHNYKKIIENHRPSGLSLSFMRLKSSSAAMFLKKIWIRLYHRF